MKNYYVYSLKHGGWITTTNTYSSSLTDAKKFERDEALQACRAHYNPRSEMEYGRIPVYDMDLSHIKEGAKF